MAGAFVPVEIMCCYCHADEYWLHRLETHLSLLQRQGVISLWHDRLLIPGTNWAMSLDAHLETASVILLLVSADFLASDYCYSIEMKRALERQEAREARVVPILVHPADWRDSPFAHLSVLPVEAKPISSWQNKEKALAEVAANIRRIVTEDLPKVSVQASREAFPAIWNLPYPRNPFFLGRVSELVQLHQNLQNSQASAFFQPQAISGLGGIGKTQLALEYAYRYRQHYQVILWTLAESIEALVSSFISIATLLQLPERGAKEQDITIQAVKNWLQTHRDWLLILDNADELSFLSDFLPPNPGGHVLLTTRAGATGRLARRLEIETFQPEQGALFLLRRAAIIAPDAVFEQVSEEEQEMALQISQDLGGLPLALDQAGAYLEETGTNLSGYQQIYQNHRAAVWSKRRGVTDDYPRSVAATWSASFQEVKKQNPAASELLQMLAFFSPDAVPEEIFITGAPHFGSVLAPIAADLFLFNQTIEGLRAYSLLLRNRKEKTLSIHRVVQAILQDQISETEKGTWARRAVLATNATFPNVKHGTWNQSEWNQCERLLSQSLNAAQLVKQYHILDIDAGRLLHETASYLIERARITEAESLFQQALYIREQLLGSEHLDVASSLNGLADLYLMQVRYSEAEPLYKQALYIREKLLGEEHPEVTYSLHGLATLYREQSKYVEAELLYQRALRIREEKLGPEHPDVAFPLNSLAFLYYQQGRFAEAEPLYQRALRIGEQLLGSEHPETANTLNSLAHLYWQQGKYTQAKPLYQRALHIREQQLGPDHYQVAYSLNGLAILHYDLGKYAEAEPLYQRALRIREKTLGPDHPEVAYPLNGLATLYREQGRYAEAEPLFQRALRIREKTLGTDHPQVTPPLNGLAKLYREQGRYAKAELLFQRSLRIREEKLGSDHPDVTTPLNGLALLYYDLGKYAQAEPLYQRALHIQEETLGLDHPDVADTLNWLANLYRDLGKYVQAEPLYRRALRIREETLGPDHPDTAENIHDIAVFQEVQGHHQEALPLYQQALMVRMSILGPQHYKTQDTLQRFEVLSQKLDPNNNILLFVEPNTSSHEEQTT